MKDMTKVNLTLDSFAQNVVDELYRKYDAKVANDIEINIQESDWLDDLYEKGYTVGEATQEFVSIYNDHNNVSWK